MKKLFFGAVLLSSVILNVSAFANKEDCAQNPLQCVYFTGLDENNFADGRYIKSVILTKNFNFSFTSCSNNAATFDFAQEDGADLLGKVHQEFSICSDLSGSKCEVLKTFTTEVYQDKKTGNYIANPQYVNIDLAKVKNNYPTCNVANSFNRVNTLTKLRNL